MSKRGRGGRAIYKSSKLPAPEELRRGWPMKFVMFAYVVAYAGSLFVGLMNRNLFVSSITVLVFAVVTGEVADMVSFEAGSFGLLNQLICCFFLLACGRFIRRRVLPLWKRRP